MMRESGFEVPVDEATKAKFTEMRYLESSIGKNGAAGDPADVPHEPQGPVAAVYAGEVMQTCRDGPFPAFGPDASTSIRNCGS